MLAAGGDHVDTDDALAGRAEHAAVPAVAALQKVTADAHTLAVAGRKEQALGFEFGRQDTAALAWSDDGGQVLGVDCTVIKVADVEQHPPVAHVVARPTVAPGPHADFHLMGGGVADCSHDDARVVGLHDDVGIAVRSAGIPYCRAAGGLVTVVTALERAAVG